MFRNDDDADESREICRIATRTARKGQRKRTAVQSEDELFARAGSRCWISNCPAKGSTFAAPLAERRRRLRRSFLGNFLPKAPVNRKPRATVDALLMTINCISCRLANSFEENRARLCPFASTRRVFGIHSLYIMRFARVFRSCETRQPRVSSPICAAWSSTFVYHVWYLLISAFFIKTKIETILPEINLMSQVIIHWNEFLSNYLKLAEK